MNSISWPDHLLTLEEWYALPEDVSRQFELVEGMLQMSPRPTVAHQRARKRLVMQLDPVLAEHGLETTQEVDLVLSDEPLPTLRAPDLAIVETALLDAAAKRLEAAQVRLVVEIVPLSVDLPALAR